VPPIPLLQPWAGRRTVRPDSDDYLTLHTRLIRNRNRVTHAINTATEAAERALRRLEGGIKLRTPSA